MNDSHRNPSLRLVPGTASRAEVGRDRIAAALRRCSEPQRTMLALVLVERLSSAEAAAVLGVTVSQFERSYRSLIADLRRAMDRTNAARWRAVARRAASEVARLRKAS